MLGMAAEQEWGGAGTQRQLSGFTGPMGSSNNLGRLHSGGGSGLTTPGGPRRRSDQGLDGAMDRHASLQSLRAFPQAAPNSLLQKIESMASTAVRAAAKIKVRCADSPQMYKIKVWCAEFSQLNKIKVWSAEFSRMNKVKVWCAEFSQMNMIKVRGAGFSQE